MSTSYGNSYEVKDELGNVAKEWRFDEPKRIISAFPTGVGSGQCVALVQDLLKMPLTIYWFDAGIDVYGNHTLKEGTVIATFIGGKYLSIPHGNHAAIYIKQIFGGFLVIDQWRHEGKLKAPGFREIHNDPKESLSNNATAFSVVRTSGVKRR